MTAATIERYAKAARAATAQGTVDGAAYEPGMLGYEESKSKRIGFAAYQNSLYIKAVGGARVYYKAAFIKAARLANDC